MSKPSSASEPVGVRSTETAAAATDLAPVVAELEQLEAELHAAAIQGEKLINELPESSRAGARNLLHYLALRRADRRPLQRRLADLGLSSLGRAEPHVLANVQATLRAARALAGLPIPSAPAAPMSSGASLARAAHALLGPAPQHRTVRVMVTMPSEAADDSSLILNLLAQGMDVMRINCAHDDERTWSAMIDRLHAASASTNRPCKVMMDIPGPKLRTAALTPGPRVVSWNPARGPIGELIRPARILLVPAPASMEHLALRGRELDGQTIDAVLPLSPSLLARLSVAPASDQQTTFDLIALRDARARKRLLRVQRAVTLTSATQAFIAHCDGSAFVIPSTPFWIDGDEQTVYPAGDLPSITLPIVLRIGDEITLSADQQPGTDAPRDPAGHCLRPARVPITLPQAIDALRVGHRVRFDDGKAEGVVIRTEPGLAHLRMTHTRAAGFRLAADKGLNFPDTHIPVDALSPRDQQCLPLIASRADMVGLSFARSTDDIRSLRLRLHELNAPHVGIVLKVETAQAFARLPELLLELMHSPSCGVMIARGDLGVEIGFERLAEVQEEILWLCEAAHIPVIWATQVLESLAKKGLPSRGEITDAAMGERAECVMLNKGPYVLDAVRVLDDILTRMSAHQSKKSPMLRPLSIAQTPPPAR